MGLLDDVMKQSGGLGGVAEWAMKHPQAVSAAVALLSSRDASVGGTGGLAGLASAFQKGGLGDVMSQWIATGPNPPISPAQLSGVLGNDVIGQFAQKAGLGQADASSTLASLLPTLVDHLTPKGQMPDSNGLETALGGLLGSLNR